MKTGNIQGRFGLLFLVFALLVLISVGTTFWGIETQKAFAVIINLAVRQRMLIQQMTRQSLEIERGGGPELHAVLQESLITFDQSMIALKKGGPAPLLAEFPMLVVPTWNSAILNELDNLAALWMPFRENVQIVLRSDPGSQQFQNAVGAVEKTSPQLVQKADDIVRQYESAATDESNRLKWIQIIFLVSLLLLLGLAGGITQRSVIQPLKQLGKVAERIGGGDLSTPVNVTGLTEIRLFANRLEEMRSQLEASQQEARLLTDTLEERVIQRTRELEALYAVSREITSQLDINYVLKSVTDKARQLLGGEIAYLCMLDDQRRTLNLQSTSGIEGAVIQPSTAANLQLAGQILSGQDALKCGVQGCRGYCEIMATPYQTSHIAAPLHAGGRVIGALCVGCSQPDFFPDEALGLLTRLANVAAVALENARLYEQAERSATLEERQRLAADMHDGLAQTLSYLQMMVDLARGQVELDRTGEALTTMEQCRKAIEAASLETRRAIASLQEEIPRNCPLQEQLENLVMEFRHGGYQIEWKTALASPVILSTNDTEQVLRVVREALVNSQHHSHAKHVQVGLEQENGQLVAFVQDDGIGFDTPSQSNPNGSRHFGLSIMRARASRIDGKLDIQSSPGEGSLVKLSWPLKLDKASDERLT